MLTTAATTYDLSRRVGQRAGCYYQVALEPVSEITLPASMRIFDQAHRMVCPNSTTRWSYLQ